MSEKERIDILQKIEADFPVQQMYYKGVEVWPILRLLYTFAYEIEPSEKVINNRLSKIKFPAQQILKSNKIEKEDKEGNLTDLKHSDIVFVARAYNRRELYQGKYFSKYANALQAYIEEHTNFSILEYSVFDVFFQPRYGQSKLINKPIYTTLLKQKIKNLLPKRSAKIEQFDAFLNYLKNKDLKTNASGKAIQKDVELIFLYRDYFIKTLAALKPKAVLFICYYTKVHMGLILACKALRIKSVEVQHGEQSLYNYKYNGWTNIPNEGYQLLPSDFWVWGMPNFRQINEWASTTQNHKASLGGNPWMNFYLKNIFKKSPAPKRLTEVVVGKRYKVLISLQYFEDFEKSPLADAIRLSDNDFIWFIRLHPKLMADKPKVDQLLKSKGCLNYDLDIANELNLYQLFEVVDLQITFWSTVAYEALLFDIHTIIVHPYGYETLKDYIHKNHFKYTLDSQEIVNIIRVPNFTKETEKFIETDDRIIEAQIEEILEKSKV